MKGLNGKQNIYFKKWSWDHLNNFLLWKKNVGDYLNYFKMSKDFLSIKAIEEIKDMKEKTKYISGWHHRLDGYGFG